MKKTIQLIASFLILFSGTSLLAAEKLAELVQYPGFMPPQFANIVKITLMSDGEVLRSVKNVNAPEAIVKTIAQLEPTIVNALVAGTEQFHDGSLLDLQLGEPMCMDAPSRRIFVKTNLNDSTEVSKWANCHDYALEDLNERYRVQKLVDFLNLMHRLAN